MNGWRTKVNICCSKRRPVEVAWIRLHFGVGWFDFFRIILVQRTVIFFAKVLKSAWQAQNPLWKKQNPFKHTSDVRKPETQIRLRGYEYYVRAEILQAYVHACVIVLQYNTPVNDLLLQKGTAREDSGCAVSSESALLQLQPRILIRTSVHA